MRKVVKGFLTAVVLIVMLPVFLAISLGICITRDDDYSTQVALLVFTVVNALAVWALIYAVAFN